MYSDWLKANTDCQLCLFIVFFWIVWRSNLY